MVFFFFNMVPDLYECEARFMSQWKYKQNNTKKKNEKKRKRKTCFRRGGCILYISSCNNYREYVGEKTRPMAQSDGRRAQGGKNEWKKTTKGLQNPIEVFEGGRGEKTKKRKRNPENLRKKKQKKEKEYERKSCACFCFVCFRFQLYKVGFVLYQEI